MLLPDAGSAESNGIGLSTPFERGGCGNLTKNPIVRRWREDTLSNPFFFLSTHARTPTHCIICTRIVCLLISVAFSISPLRVHRSIMMALHVAPCLASQSPPVHIYFVCYTSMSKGIFAAMSKRSRARLMLNWPASRSERLLVDWCMLVAWKTKREAAKRRARLGQPRSGHQG